MLSHSLLIKINLKWMLSEPLPLQKQQQIDHSRPAAQVPIGGIRIFKTHKATSTLVSSLIILKKQQTVTALKLIICSMYLLKIFERKAVLFSCNRAFNHYGEPYMNSATLIRFFRTTSCVIVGRVNCPFKNVLEKSLKYHGNKVTC